jgi:hypothetical protein
MALVLPPALSLSPELSGEETNGNPPYCVHAAKGTPARSAAANADK